jgi:hypothetical protein
MIRLHSILLILAFACFALAALIDVRLPRVQLVPLGLALWMLAILLGGAG